MSSVERASYRIDAVLFKKFARHACGGVRRRRVMLGPGRLTQGTSHRWEVPAHPRTRAHHVSQMQAPSC